jgi:hypothetical protein
LTVRVSESKDTRDYTLGIDRLREWPTCPGTTVNIRPVIDLAQNIESRGYQPSPTLREQVTLRNRACAFPHCTRTARNADLDHTRGDPTRPCSPRGRNHDTVVAPAVPRLSPVSPTPDRSPRPHQARGARTSRP